MSAAPTRSPLAAAAQRTGSRASVFGGYALGAALMLFAALVAARYAVNAERNPLERVAPPLSLNQPPL